MLILIMYALVIILLIILMIIHDKRIQIRDDVIRRLTTDNDRLNTDMRLLKKDLKSLNIYLVVVGRLIG